MRSSSWKNINEIRIIISFTYLFFKRNNREIIYYHKNLHFYINLFSRTNFLDSYILIFFNFNNNKIHRISINSRESILFSTMQHIYIYISILRYSIREKQSKEEYIKWIHELDFTVGNVSWNFTVLTRYKFDPDRRFSISRFRARK